MEKEIIEAEIRIIDDFIDRVKKEEIIRKPKYICETIIELFGDPYNYPCWHCSRWKRFGLIQRCSWVRFGAKLGLKESPLFGMTGLELLQEMRKEI